MTTSEPNFYAIFIVFIRLDAIVDRNSYKNHNTPSFIFLLTLYLSQLKHRTCFVVLINVYNLER